MRRAHIHRLLLCLLSLTSGWFLPTYAANPAYPTPGIVVSEEKLASDVGLEILKAGGNAIDAAVAVGYALAVVDPCCGNIGGGGFMTIHLANGQTIFLNFREKASLTANKNLYTARPALPPDASTVGYLAVGVPGTVLGLDSALARYGTMTRKAVMAPAIKLAKQGFIVSPYFAQQLADSKSTFQQQPNIAAIFLKNGQPYQAGERLVQTDLADTLTRIANKGPAAFYHGFIAKTIVAASKMHGGILTMTDFTHYQVEWLKPLVCHYQSYTIYSAPPPSSGGTTLCEALGIIKNFPLAQMGRQQVASVHAIIEAMGYSFHDRNHLLGDPDYVHNPVAHLISTNYTKMLSEKIKAHPGPLQPKTVNHTFELTDTTHYSVLDSQGNAVSVTYTLNNFFGAGRIAGNTGFFLNDEMNDFTTHPGKPNKFGLVQSDKNDIQPGKRPLSSMTPTIITHNNHVVLVIGSPGGPRIISTVLLAIINYFDFHMPLQAAINAPRYHYQADPNIVFTEPNTFPTTLLRKLTDVGYTIESQATWGAIAAIGIQKHQWIGVCDYRRPDCGVN